MAADRGVPETADRDGPAIQRTSTPSAVTATL